MAPTGVSASSNATPGGGRFSVSRAAWHGVSRGAFGVAKALTSPLLPDDAIGLINPLLSGADLHGRIISVTPATPHSVHVRIRPGRGWRGHMAGQYIRVGVDVDGVRHWRAYSLTSGPGERDLEITTKLIPDGVVSHHLVHSAKPGDVILLDQATGEFVLSNPLPSRPLFLTAGSGITPIMGMLRHHLNQLDGVTLMHSSPTASEFVFGDELRSMAGAGRLQLIERHTDTEGWLTPTMLDALVPDWRERHTWACGPTAMLDAFQAHFDDAGVAHQFHHERFRAKLVAPGDGGVARFAQSGIEVDADGATTLLDAGEAAGVLLPSGCRMGICYNCSSTLLEGSVRDLRNGHLTVVDPVQNPHGERIQTCISAVAGSCRIDR